MSLLIIKMIIVMNPSPEMSTISHKFKSHIGSLSCLWYGLRRFKGSIGLEEIRMSVCQSKGADKVLKTEKGAEKVEKI